MKNRPNGIMKIENEYQKLISQKFYERTPKAVFAALAVSHLINRDSVIDENIDRELRKEWELLYNQNIIPQKPVS